MQRIERYGVIALVFLLVTILAVAVWGQRKNQSLLSFMKRDKATDAAKVDATAPGATAPNTGLGLSSPTHEVTPGTPLPLNVGGPTDPALTLATPAGPGASAVTFEQTALPTGTQPNAGFVTDTGLNGSGLVQQTPPVSPANSPVDAGPRTYKVKSGDTLGSIAQHELGSTKRWKEIEALNGVKADRLSVGTVLKLPAGASSSGAQVLAKVEASPHREPATESSTTRTYSVRSGDSLSKIASSQLGDANRYAEILVLNPGLNPAKLAVGQSLRMPADANGANGAKNRATESKPKPRPSQGTSELARVDAPKKAKVQ